MASIASLGTGSGLDLESIVTKFMTVEKQPLTALNKREASYQASISSLGTLKGSLASLQTAAAALTPATGQSATAKFSTYQASVADSTIASVTASSSAVAGTYTLEVTALATAQSQSLKNIYGASEKVIDPSGGNTLTLTKGSGASATSVDITLDSAKTTLADLRDAINNASAGVSAVIVTDTNSKQHLQLTATDTGTANAVTLSGVKFAAPADPADGSALDASLAFDTTSATDSAAKVNGIAVSGSGNTLTGAVDGLTINLLKTNAGSPTTITLSRDTSTLKNNLYSLVKAYNDLNSTISSLGSYDATTKVAGALNGDATLRSTQSQLRAVFGSVPSSLSGATYQRLSDIGISVGKTGALSIDSTKLQKALDTNFTAVANAVGAYGSIFKGTTDNLLSTSGTIAARTDGLNRSVTDIGKQRDALSLRLTNIEKQYRAQFTALDTAVASMQSTSSYLTQQLTGIANITNYNSNSK
jgi:flagellar hook-associated protein 2